MVFYAIKNKKTGKLITGTTWNDRQLFSDIYPPKLFDKTIIDTEIKCRKINLKYYKIVKVEIKELEEV